MERGGGTGRHYPCLTEKRLLGVLCRVCPEEGSMLASFMNEQQNILPIVGVLCMLYRFQNREIHEMARRQDPSLSMSLGDREWRWIEQGGPARFFARVGKTLQEHYPEIFDQGMLAAAWEYFQALLTVEHIVYTARLQGRTPSQGEPFLNSGLTDWYFRLAKRFEPIRPMPEEVLH